MSDGEACVFCDSSWRTVTYHQVSCSKCRVASNCPRSAELWGDYEQELLNHEGGRHVR